MKPYFLSLIQLASPSQIQLRSSLLSYFPISWTRTFSFSSSLLLDDLVPAPEAHAPKTETARSGGGRDTLGRRLLALIFPKRSAIVVLRKWAEEGKYIQKYQLNRVVRELRKYKPYKHALELAKKYHPDANKNNPASKRKFQEIRDAYETLRDSEKRAQYDEKFSRGSQRIRYSADNTEEFHESYYDPFTGFNKTNHDPFSGTFYKIFSEVFEHERETHSSNIEVELNLSFAEAAKGCTKQVSFYAQLLCNSCYGSGHPVNAKPSRCPTCNGVGKVTVFPFTSTCRSCRGSGKIIKDHCPVCGGVGVVDGVKNVNVTIPAGVDSGDTIRVPNAGNQGGHGAHPGNLNIKLQVEKDPVFERDGADIYVDTQISFTQAILGGKLEVPTLSGKTEVKIPKGVQPGQLLILRGRGLPKHGWIDHGDQYVRFRVHFPSSVNERQRELLEEFAKEVGYQESNESADGNWWEQIISHLTGPNITLGIALLLLVHLLVSKSLS